MKKETILINGCSTGLGLDTYKHLEKKYDVFGLSSNSTGKNIFFFNPLKNPKISIETENKLKKINFNHIIHCAGGGLGYREKNLSIEKLIELFNINFFSIFAINKLIINNKSKSKPLNIIMVSSIAAFEDKASIGYTVAKSTLLSYNKLLATNFIKEKVTSKLIVPGSFLSTNGSMRRLKKKNKNIFKRLQNKLPNKKFQKSSEIIDIINFLLDKRSNLLNGSYVSLNNLESKSFLI